MHSVHEGVLHFMKRVAFVDHYGVRVHTLTLPFPNHPTRWQVRRTPSENRFLTPTCYEEDRFLLR
jgi:hypothetical protein